MALIKFPTENWDTFADIVDADTIIGGFVVSEGVTAYLALDDAGKEAILRQTAMQMKLCPNITLPDQDESDLNYAQCYLVTHSLVVDTISYDPTARAITAESVDVIATSYDVNLKDDPDTFPPIVTSLLNQYGCNNSGGGFSQSTVARV